MTVSAINYGLTEEYRASTRLGTPASIQVQRESDVRSEVRTTDSRIFFPICSHVSHFQRPRYVIFDVMLRYVINSAQPYTTRTRCILECSHTHTAPSFHNVP